MIFIFIILLFTSTYTNAERLSQKETKAAIQLLNQANNLFYKQKYSEAIINYKKVTDILPNCAMAYFNLGIAHEITNNIQNALKYLTKAIELDPWHAKAHYELARLLHIKNKNQKALEHCIKCTHINPYFFEAHHLLGDLHQALNDVPNAVKAYSHALQLNPTHKDILLSLAHLTYRQDKKSESITAYYEILAQQPDSTNALYNLAYTLKNTDKVDEAIACYAKVLERDPQRAHAHLGIAQCYLIHGDLKKGFQELEWRAPEIKKFKHYDWKDADLTGKTILIRCEWGFGDCIQFIRYLKLIKDRGARVLLQTYKPLVDLFSLCPYIDEVIPSGCAFPKHDIQVPLLSLPYTFGTTFETIPNTIPYLYADQKLINFWREKLPAKKLKIGICWRGNGDHKAPLSLNKNIPLNTFAPLAELKDVRLYSLQKIRGCEELKNCSFNLHIFENDFDKKNGRFMDTAAVIKNLDLIVTMDTSIAHLAGALGTPVWILLPYKADWRWMLDRNDSPWYPTMRLFKQKNPGDWAGVMQEIITALG